MKKISILCVVIALAMTMSLGVGTCFAVGNYDPVESEIIFLQDVSILSTGTYRVSVAEGYDMGSFVVYDENDEVKDFVVITENDYGYIFFDAAAEGLTFDYMGVNFEFVSSEDLGVSSYHVFEIVEGRRDYDPVVDGEYESPIVNIEDLSESDLAFMFA